MNEQPLRLLSLHGPLNYEGVHYEDAKVELSFFVDHFEYRAWPHEGVEKPFANIYVSFLDYSGAINGAENLTVGHVETFLESIVELESRIALPAIYPDINQAYLTIEDTLWKMAMEFRGRPECLLVWRQMVNCACKEADFVKRGFPHLYDIHRRMAVHGRRGCSMLYDEWALVDLKDRFVSFVRSFLWDYETYPRGKPMTPEVTEGIEKGTFHLDDLDYALYFPNRDELRKFIDSADPEKKEGSRWKVTFLAADLFDESSPELVILFFDREKHSAFLAITIDPSDEYWGDVLSYLGQAKTFAHYVESHPGRNEIGDIHAYDCPVKNPHR